jgi:hypothetical protein
MNRRLLSTVALAVAAFAATPALAQAAPALWRSDGKVIPAGVVEPVATSGKLTITLRKPSGGILSVIKCKVKDRENIQNGPNGGIDEMVVFTLTGCKGKPSPCPAGTHTEVIAHGLPWRTALTLTTPIRDEIIGMVLEVRCGTQLVVGVYGGTLLPVVGNSVLNFDAASGVLSGGAGTLQIAGTDKLKGPANDKKITATM